MSDPVLTAMKDAVVAGRLMRSWQKHHEQKGGTDARVAFTTAAARFDELSTIAINLDQRQRDEAAG